MEKEWNPAMLDFLEQIPAWTGTFLLLIPNSVNNNNRNNFLITYYVSGTALYVERVSKSGHPVCRDLSVNKKRSLSPVT